MTQPIVVFFAKAPRPGSVKTRLCPPLEPAEAAELYQAFLADLLVRFAFHRSPYALAIAVDPPDAIADFESVAPRGFQVFPQRGATLAERMSNAFSDGFAMGHGPVAIVGTDVPLLQTASVDALVAAVSTGQADLAIGPDRGGGYWGIALSKPVPSIFVSLTTSAGNVALDTLAAATSLELKHARVAAELDVDTIDDLAALAAMARVPAKAQQIPKTVAVLHALGLLHA